MEILMKLKCTPSTVAHGSAPHSTLKVVDHHHQLTQQHTTQALPVPPSLVRLPPTNSIYGQSELPLTTPSVAIPTTCLEYATSMECCNVAAVAAAAAAQQEIEILDIQWEQQRRDVLENMSHRPSSCCAITENNLFESPTCCSGISYGTPPSLATTAILPSSLKQTPHAAPMVTTIEASVDNNNTVDLNTHYEYQEPEENFVSIEDAKIKGFLMKIGRETLKEKTESQRLKYKTKNSKKVNEGQNIIYEIIDLDDEDDREELRQIKNQVEFEKKQIENKLPTETIVNISSKTPKIPHKIKSPSISLIPKSPNTTITISKPVHNAAKERIIAHIELSDSSDSELEDQDQSDNQAIVNDKKPYIANVNDSDDEELPLAAAAVSCELECDDDDDEGDTCLEIDTQHDGNSSNGVVVLNSDDENIDLIEKNEEHIELRWNELEEQKERNFFECYLCGKKVQSSYNLRRHMMIHTGERPFSCDLCDRRFREFSDLKKHRRRHANDPNFVCMVCRINAPMMQDPTRCTACDSKTSAITAAMRPQVTSPDKSHTSPPPPLPPLVAAPTRQTELNPASEPVFTPTLTTNSISITIVSGSSDALSDSPKQVEQVTVRNTVTLEPASLQQQQKQMDMPSLVPIKSSVTKVTSTQLLLDSIPVVHRPSYNQLGVITRKEFPCPLCQRPFGTRHNLKRHFMIHTGEKPFSCVKCRKPFREYSTLKKHMVTHQRDRFYKCLRCPKKYRDYLDYNEHKKVHPTDEINWDMGTSSTVSPKKKAKLKYTNDSSYDSNEEDSSAEDWLECCECKQRFTDIETYTEHLKEHDPGLFLYECYICKKAFELRDELVEHMSACKEELRETALNRAKCAG